MDPKALRAELTRYFRETPAGLVCAYLFGSYARGEPRGDSDIDVAVLFPPDGTTVARRRTLQGPLTAVRGDLERLLRRSVDVVDMRDVPVDLVHRILRDGQLLEERDSGERIRFEVDKRNEYFDLLPHLERYRRGRAA